MNHPARRDWRGLWVAFFVFGLMPLIFYWLLATD
jgi:hypothetical protein